MTSIVKFCPQMKFSVWKKNFTNRMVEYTLTILYKHPNISQIERGHRCPSNCGGVVGEVKTSYKSTNSAIKQHLLVY